MAVEGGGPFAKDQFRAQGSTGPQGIAVLNHSHLYINTVRIEAVGVVYTSLLGVKSYD